ncbi:hypothetical protein D3C72_1815810 [compost metagenome]
MAAQITSANRAVASKSPSLIMSSCQLWPRVLAGMPAMPRIMSASENNGMPAALVRMVLMVSVVA